MSAAACMTAAPLGNSHPQSVGRMILHVRGRLSDIVLVDPSGRTDRDGDTLVSEIPGCDRWPGGIGELYLDDEEFSDSSDTEMTSFELAIVQQGHYVLRARADQETDATVEATFIPEPMDTAVGGARLGKSDHLPAGSHSWTITIRPSSPEGGSRLAISGPTKQKGPAHR